MAEQSFIAQHYAQDLVKSEQVSLPAWLVTEYELARGGEALPFEVELYLRIADYVDDVLTRKHWEEAGRTEELEEVQVDDVPIDSIIAFDKRAHDLGLTRSELAMRAIRSYLQHLELLEALAKTDQKEEAE